MKVRNELKSFLHKHTVDKASLYIVDALSKIGENFHFKNKQPLLMKSGIVYKLTCSCGSTYIGQTKPNLLSRIKEHATSEKSEVLAVNTYFKILPIAWILIRQRY